MFSFLIFMSFCFACAYWPFWRGSGFGAFDWAKEELLYAHVRACWKEFKQLPRHFYSLPPIVSDYPSFHTSQNVFGNPEFPYFSPFFVFFPAKKLITFWKYYVAGHLFVGMLGLWLIISSLQFHFAPALILFTLTIFSPWLMQHLAIGYSPWITAMWLPLAVWCTYFSTWGILGSIIGGIILTLTLYGGGFHVFVWFALATLIYGSSFMLLTFKANILLHTIIMLSIAVLIASPRLISSMLLYKNFRRPANKSYNSWFDIKGILTDRKTPKYDLPFSFDVYNTNFYDASTFVGWSWIGSVGAIFGAVILFCLLNGHFFGVEACLLALLFSALVFMWAGWDGNWKKVIKIIPPLSCEIYPYRFLAIAVFLVSIALALTIEMIARSEPSIGVFAIPLSVYWLWLAARENWIFSQVAVQDKSNWNGLELKKYWKNTLMVATYPGGRIFSPTVTPRSVTIEIEDHELTDDLVVNWLKPELQNEFELVGGTYFVEAGFTMIKPTTTKVELKPRLFPP